MITVFFSVKVIREAQPAVEAEMGPFLTKQHRLKP
jgi:hypothetical protein